MSESEQPGGEEIAVLTTNLGTIKLKFFPEKAPKHVAAFKKLAQEGYYDGTKFHRVIPGFMIQGGDPNTKSGDRSRYGTGGPGYQLDAEFNDIPHDRGILSAARTSDPNSAGSQFFLMVARAPHLDRQYTVYGQVIEGMDVVDKIVALPRDGRDCPKPDNEAVIESVHLEG
ncbi:MAG TPA: peptidylprolyl isomerase [Fimbriimonadaceae bacterium]|nr:peptidylprolyl isomerase [Fimbriimonadaceae bacterium]